jgi:DNA-binding transcriptional ArsR family regulator
MTEAAQLAALAGLLADETRAAFCLALLDGRAWTAGELARHAGVAPSTATEHLHRLINGGFLVEDRQGRHRYVRLAGPSVAALVEDLSSHLAPAPPARTLRAATVATAMARARTCYDHFAGRLGVAIADAMTGAGLLDQESGIALTAAGREWLTAVFGADSPPSSRRPLARGCLDWTERRPHLAGRAGARICRHALDHGWVRPIGSSRAVQVTPEGALALKEHLDLVWDAA